MVRVERTCELALRRLWLTAILTLLGGATALAQNPNDCDGLGDVPDLIVGDVTDVLRNGKVGDITAYSVGATSCNIGTCALDWYELSVRHPLIGANMYRLKGGRFEQIGQAWVKHSFGTVNGMLCFNDCAGTSGSTLGVHCSDPYNGATNGAQARLGPKWEVNASTGAYPWPFTTRNVTGNTIYKRLQVHDAELEPDLNAGAQYYVESTYTYTDDAPMRDSLPDGNGDGLDDYDVVDNSRNNSSYRRINITEGSPGTYTASVTGPTVREKTALSAWQVVDPGVLIKELVVPGDGRFYVGSRATDNGNGTWHYEYSVFNQSSHRSAASFSIPVPFGANVSNIGFHDVDYHSENTDGSGSYYDSTDWSAVVGDNFAVTWTVSPAGVPGRENALRWTTLYNFRFDVDVAPASSGNATIGLYLVPENWDVRAIVPSACDGDAVCDRSESQLNCPADCVNQGGGGGVCGDSTCNGGEGPCTCLRDCGAASVEEFFCSDADDNDCDGLFDCADSDCCSDAVCDGPDGDMDGFAACDCNSADPNLWYQPGEAGNLQLQHAAGSGTTLSWEAPLEPGATSIVYEALRSQNPANFLSSTVCLPDGDTTDTTLVDASADPSAGGCWYYDVRGRNACPAGVGPLGQDSNNIPREGRVCP